MVSRNRMPRLGDVYMIRFSGNGSVQDGYRPGVIIQNNTGNQHSPNVIALPMTSSIKKTWQPTHVIIPANGSGLLTDSMVLCENPQCINKDRLERFVTTLSFDDMRKVAAGYLIASGLIVYLDQKAIRDVNQMSIRLNQVG